MRKTIFISIVLVLSLHAWGQIKVDSSAVDYSLRMHNRILSFRKAPDSTDFTGVRYSLSLLNRSGIELKSEMDTVKLLWEAAEGKINLNLQYVDFSYPLAYTDIQKRQVLAFKKAKAWKEHIKKNGKKLNTKLIHQVMLKENVYYPLNEFLQSKGYKITGFSTEKHGFMEKKELVSMGFTGSEIIPIPYMVWIRVERNNSR